MKRVSNDENIANEWNKLKRMRWNLIATTRGEQTFESKNLVLKKWKKDSDEVNEH